MTEETPEQIIQRALAALAFASGVHERLAAYRALAAAQRAQEAKAFALRRAQDVLAAETPQERAARVKANWKQVKARALRISARVEPIVREVNARAARRRADAANKTTTRSDLIYKGMTPFQRLQRAKTPAEYREALKDMAVLAKIMKQRGR